jgi:putative sterol carrier protein
MPSLLSEEWLAVQQAEAGELPARPGCTARIQFQVAGAPLGTVVFRTRLEDGRVVANALGPDDDPDFTVIVPLADYRDMVRGQLDLGVGYMQGRVKVTGNVGRMLSVLPVTTSPEWREAMARVAARTDDL